MQAILQTVRRVMDKHTDPAMQQPKFTESAIVERQVIEQQMAENRAKLETFRAQETEFRALLAGAYGSLAYEAARAEFKVETRQWITGDSLETRIEHLNAALDAHGNCQDEIDYLVRSLAEDQAELDDTALWITDEGYRRNGGAQ